MIDESEIKRNYPPRPEIRKGDVSLHDCDIFISHATVDIARILPIINRLEEEGLVCWYYERNLNSRHPHWEDAIVDSLKRCKSLIVFNSDVAKSSEVTWELEVKWAHDLKMPRFEYRLDDVANHEGRISSFPKSDHSQTKVINPRAEEKISLLVESLKEELL